MKNAPETDEIIDNEKKINEKINWLEKLSEKWILKAEALLLLNKIEPLLKNENPQINDIDLAIDYETESLYIIEDWIVKNEKPYTTDTLNDYYNELNFNSLPEAHSDENINNLDNLDIQIKTLREKIKKLPENIDNITLNNLLDELGILFYKKNIININLIKKDLENTNLPIWKKDELEHELNWLEYKVYLYINNNPNSELLKEYKKNWEQENEELFKLVKKLDWKNDNNELKKIYWETEKKWNNSQLWREKLDLEKILDYMEAKINEG